MTRARDLSKLLGTNSNGVIDNSNITLDANEVPNLDASKITTGELANARVADLPASKITSGTFADARISQSSVSQHATSFDDSKLQQDIMVLALQQATDANRSAYNLSNAFVEQFEDSTGIDVQTNTSRNASEYVSSISLSSESGGTSSNVGAFGTGWTDTNFSFANSNLNITFDVTSYNYGGYSSNSLTGNYTFKFKASTNNISSAETNSGVQIGVSISNTTFDTGNSVYNAGSNNFFYVGFAGTGNQTVRFYRGTTTQASVSVNVTSNYVFQFVRSSSGTLKVYGGEFTNPYSDGGTLLHTFTGYSDTGDNRIIFGVGFPNSVSTNSGTTIANNFTVNNNITTLYGIETVSATGNFTSVSQTAPATVSKMGIVVLYKNNYGTATLNTDLVAQVSANNGTDYTTVTLTPRGTFSSGINIAVANNITVTSGTSCKYKISFANQSLNTKETQVHGVGLIY